MSRYVYALQDKLDDLVDLILEERVYHFYSGIVRDLKREIDKMLNDYSQSLCLNFLPDFKWYVHLYALLKFIPIIKSFQEKWHKENTPLGILDQRKEEYLKMIDIRLESNIVEKDLFVFLIEFERKDAVRHLNWLC